MMTANSSIFRKVQARALADPLHRDHCVVPVPVRLGGGWAVTLSLNK
jgi:hypothetical protein